MSKLEDAYKRLAAAEDRLKHLDYAGTLREAQACIELSVKALLDELGIDYRGKRDRIPHDVSDLVPKAFEELKDRLEDYEYDLIRLDLARAAVLLRMLTSIAGFLEYGVAGREPKEVLAGASETFDSSFRELAEAVVRLARISHGRIRDLVMRKTKRNA